MSAGYPYPIVPPLPEYEKRTETTRPTHSRTEEERKLTPEQIDAQERQDTLLHTQTLLADQEGHQRQAESNAAADLAKQQADQAAAVEKQRQAAIEASQKAINEHRQRVETTQARLDATPAPKFFQEGDTWHNALRGVGAAVAGVGDAIATGAAIRAGHAPQNIDTVSQIIDRDLNRQRERIGMLKDQVVMARTGLTDANQARQQMLADIDLKAASAYDRLAKFGAARLAALKTSAPDIETNKEILALIGKREEARQKALEPLHQTVTKHLEGLKRSVAITNRDPVAATKSPTESQAKLADLSAGLLSELKTINGLPALTQDELAKVQNNQASSNAADNATSPIGVIGAKVGRAVGVVPRTKYDGLTPEAQKSMNAWDAAVELRARQLTGAGMPEQEAIREARTLGYSPGDSPEVMQQKITRLHDAATRGIELSGNAGPKVAPPAAPTHAPTEPPPFQAGGPVTPPPAAPAASSPPVRTPARPPAAAPQSPAKLPDKLSGNSGTAAAAPAVAERIKGIQSWLKSPDARTPEGKKKAQAAIARLRKLQSVGAAP